MATVVVALNRDADETDGQGAEGGDDRERHSSQMDPEDLSGSDLMPNEEDRRQAVNETLSDTFSEVVADMDLDENVSVSVAAGDGKYELDFNADQTHSAASIVKLEVLAMLVEHYGSPAEIPGWVDELIHDMVGKSDNEATNRLLFNILDGHSALREAHEHYGMDSTHEHPEQRWGYTESTAGDQKRLLDVMFSEESEYFNPEQREYFRSVLAEVVPEQRWGVSAAVEDGESGWVKNGWDTRYEFGVPWVVHSSGEVTDEAGEPIRLVIMTSGFDTQAEAIDVIETLAPEAQDLMARAEDV